jgi:hypothetical protein
LPAWDQRAVEDITAIVTKQIGLPSFSALIRLTIAGSTPDT